MGFANVGVSGMGSTWFVLYSFHNRIIINFLIFLGMVQLMMDF
jgi:hypothetical protein